MWPSEVNLYFTIFLSQLLPKNSILAQEIEELGGDLKKMTFSTPELSEDEKYAMHMPDQHKCDGCMAITFTLHMEFYIKHQHHIKNPDFIMDHGQILDIFGKGP